MKRLLDVVTTLLELAGAAAVTFGCWLIWSPLGFIVGGILAIALSFFITHPIGRR